MVRIRSTFDTVLHIALAYAVAFQALFGALAGPAFAGTVDSSLILCRSSGEGTPEAPAGSHQMPADHCAVMCQLGSAPFSYLPPPRAHPGLAPGDTASETLAPAVVAMPYGPADRAPNARGPPPPG